MYIEHATTIQIGVEQLYAFLSSALDVRVVNFTKRLL